MNIIYDPILGKLRQADTASTNENLSDNQLIITNSTTGIKTRLVATETGYRLDITLTVLGFAGTESTDGGVTGDWVTTGGA